MDSQELDFQDYCTSTFEAAYQNELLAQTGIL